MTVTTSDRSVVRNASGLPAEAGPARHHAAAEADAARHRAPASGGAGGGAGHRVSPSVVPASEAGFQSYSMFSGSRPADAVPVYRTAGHSTGTQPTVHSARGAHSAPSTPGAGRGVRPCSSTLPLPGQAGAPGLRQGSRLSDSRSAACCRLGRQDCVSAPPPSVRVRLRYWLQGRRASISRTRGNRSAARSPAPPRCCGGCDACAHGACRTRPVHHRGGAQCSASRRSPGPS